MRESKECLECGGIYFRPQYAHKRTEWEARKYCSVKCANEVAVREKKGLFAERDLAAAEASETEAVREVAPVLEPVAGPGEQELAVRRRLRVVRVGPNPRLIVCEYFELAQRRLCTVNVKRNTKYVRGMSLEMAEPRSEAAFVKPWVYDGPPPRRRGRW